MKDKHEELVNAIKEYNSQIREGYYAMGGIQQREDHYAAEMKSEHGVSAEQWRMLDPMADGQTAVVYAALTKSNYNDFGALSANDTYLFFYKMVGGWRTKFKAAWCITLPLEWAIKLKISKFFIWSTLKIRYTDDFGKKRKFTFTVSDKAVGLPKQKENAEALLDYLRARVPPG